MKDNPTVVFTEPKHVTIENRPIPKPADGGMLVRTQKTLISTGTELTILNGEFPPNSNWAGYGKFPFVAGYNNIGVVIEVGKNVDQNWVGRKVASYAPHSAHTVLSPERVRVVHREIPDEEAVFFTIAEIVMNGVRRGQVTWGESVIVYGLGLLGQLVVRFCHLAGARPVIGIDISEKRLGMLPDAPGISGLSPQETDIAKVVGELTKNRMGDVVFEVTGNPDLIPEEFRVLKRQGRLVVLSSPRGVTRNFDFHDLCNSPSFTIIGAHNGSHPRFETPYNQWTQKRHAELFFNLVGDGEIDMKPLITHRIPYAEAPETYQMLLNDRTRAMGVVIDWLTDQ